jgi:proteic killer suppression protein
MIKSFKHKALEKFFRDDDRSGLNAQHCERIRRLLDAIEDAEAPEELNIPGYGLHKLIGTKKDVWSLKVSGNWRITFKFEGGHPQEINLEDYH